MLRDNKVLNFQNDILSKVPFIEYKIMPFDLEKNSYVINIYNHIMIMLISQN